MVYNDKFTETNEKTNVFETADGMVFNQAGEIFFLRDKNGWEDLVIPRILVDKDTKQSAIATSIHENLFKDSKTIKSVEIPKTITKIGSEAFKNIVTLKEFKINAKFYETSELVHIGQRAFENDMIETLDLSRTKLTYLNHNIFSLNPLKIIKLPDHAVKFNNGSLFNSFYAGSKGHTVTINGQTINKDYTNLAVDVYLNGNYSNAVLTDWLFGENKNASVVTFHLYNNSEND